MAGKPKKKTKKPAKRKRFATPAKAESNLRSISAAQKLPQETKEARTGGC